MSRSRRTKLNNTSDSVYSTRTSAIDSTLKISFRIRYSARPRSHQIVPVGDERPLRGRDGSRHPARDHQRGSAHVVVPVPSQKPPLFVNRHKPRRPLCDGIQQEQVDCEGRQSERDADSGREAHAGDDHRGHVGVERHLKNGSGRRVQLLGLRRLATRGRQSVHLGLKVTRHGHRNRGWRSRLKDGDCLEADNERGEHDHRPQLLGFFLERRSRNVKG